MIDVRNISFSYGQKAVLQDVSFSAGDGEVVGILGNNGAGKSTLITCINRVRRPDSGDVIIDGLSTGSMKERDIARLIAYVPQNTEAVRISVFDSILLGRRPYIRWGMGREDIEACQAVIERIGLGSLQLRCMDELSGGEMQKVMLARALVQKPRVMLLDEPTSNLDPRNQHEMMAVVRDMAREEHITVLAVLHDLNLALRFCDRLFFLKDGRGFCCCGRDEVDGGIIRDVYGIDAEVFAAGDRRFVLIGG